MPLLGDTPSWSGGLRWTFSLGSSLTASLSVGISGTPSWGSRISGPQPLVMIFCVFSCLGPALCPVLDGLFLFYQGSSTSWPPLTRAPTHRMDPFTNLLTHRGETWVTFSSQAIGIGLYLHGRSEKQSSLPKNCQI